MFIQTQDTPNPATIKFVPGIEVLKNTTRNYTKSDNYRESPLADSLFLIEGVEGVFLGGDFISVTKLDGHDWEYLKPIVLATIMDHFVSGMPILNDSSEKPKTAVSDDALTNQIIELIDTRIRPAVAEDGGDIVFKDFKDGVVYLEMHGACSGCPSSTVTLKSGIENMLKHYVPEVLSVEAV